MAAYPNFHQLVGTALIGDGGEEMARSVSGRPRIRTRFSQVWHVANIVHELDQADVETLKTFYEENKMIPFTFVYALDGQTYTLSFAQYPEIVPKGGGYSDVTVIAVEV